MNSTFQALISCEALYRLTQSLPRSIADMINYPYWDKLYRCSSCCHCRCLR